MTPRRPAAGEGGPGGGREDRGEGADRREGTSPPRGSGSGHDRRDLEPGRSPRGLDRPSRDEAERVRGMDRLGDLLPDAAREYGLEEQLDQARLAAAWLKTLAERVPAAAGSCRLIAFERDVATVEADLPIVAQEIRLRSPELLAALRHSSRVAVRQLRVVTRHV